MNKATMKINHPLCETNQLRFQRHMNEWFREVLRVVSKSVVVVQFRNIQRNITQTQTLSGSGCVAIQLFPIHPHDFLIH